MNQPKFKIWDKVTGPQGSFTVDQIGYDANQKMFRYWGHKLGEYKESEWGFRPMTMTEDLLELYQEPKKRKLYAYKSFYTASQGYSCFNGDVIRFFSNVDVDSFESMDKTWTRAPDYDIHFDESK